MHQHGSSNQPQPNHQQTRLSLPIKLVLYVSIGIIAYFLITEHWAHLAGFLPYSLLFICIFMHLFMHGGYGGHGGDQGGNSQSR
ncbi:hypothetical protein CDG76_12580 [Nostoc sp. 'Peltigera membranacea cyanobiont' 210A]|uniref:DUF2933 domain-containing protein n=1 Tax=Nostoc sp. 'Peltigera membranacea cyanobiont' 210A TaxID=2014529 RepID=UPI000B95531C|nr:DUF2933 domain-containing protein [Nostoc sp. 'Peltigera membranacea cyanobiont' 210A]OYD95758.1 hypothetical protein CDG76_12580 [Nostoc sp. 'Peltigera membranacea cyanobiont' 210A]